MKYKKTIFVVVSLILIGLVTLVVLKLNQVNKAATTTSGPSYTIQRLRNTADLVESGKVVANTRRQLQNPNGRITAINVKDGDHVDQDAVLLTTFDQGIQDQANALETTIKAAETGLNRAIAANNQLIAQYNAATQGDERGALQATIDKNNDDLADQRRDLQDKRAQFSKVSGQIYHNLTAPFAGILSITTDEKTGDPSITIDSDARQVLASVTEFDYDKVTNDRAVKVTGVAGGKTQTSVINDLAQVPDSTSKQNYATYPFKVAVDGRFMYGQSVKVAIPQNNIKIATDALVTRGESTFVWVLDASSKAHLQKVAGTKSNGVYTVTAGVKVGDKIVSDPDGALKAGRVIK